MTVTEFQGRMPDQLADYWLHGVGAAKIRWGTRGSFKRARRLLLKEGVPMHMVDGAVANLYHQATGEWPGSHRGDQTAAVVDAQGNLHDAQGRFTDKPGGMAKADYLSTYGDVTDDQSVLLDDERTLTVRIFDLGDAHLVVDGEDGTHLVLGELTPDTMRGLADEIEDLLMEDDPVPDEDTDLDGDDDGDGEQEEPHEPAEPDDDDAADVGHGLYVARENGTIVIADAAEDNAVNLTEDDAWNIVEALRDMADSYETEIGTQTAAAGCGCDGSKTEFHAGESHDCGEAQHRMPDGTCMDDTAMAAADGGGGVVWRWEGPIALIASPAADAQIPRQFAPGALHSRMLPLPFRWQEKQAKGHDGAVTVGALTGYRVTDDGVPWGEGYFFDETIVPQAQAARYVAQQGVIAPSIDLEPAMTVRYEDEHASTFDPTTCSTTGSCPEKPRALITRGTVAGTTLVPINAFGQLKAPRVFRGPRPPVMASEYGTQIADVGGALDGWDDIAVADLNHPWDETAAVERVAAFGADGYLWQNTLPIMDVVDGDLAVVPAAVYAAAARLAGAGVPAAEYAQVQDALSDLYDLVAEWTGDDRATPWDDDSDTKPGCGCGDKFMADQTASVDGCAEFAATFGIFGEMPPYPADVFAARTFTSITTPVIEQRPGEQFARIAGHIGDWKGCHRGFKHVCLPPPKSKTGYAEFHTAGHVRTTDGLVRVGKMVMGEGHPSSSVTASVARAFYDATSKQVAFGCVYEDKFGPYFVGVVAPNVTPAEATTLLASPVSGDWKNHELIAVLAVNVAGHPIRPQATFAADGEVANVVAAGRFWPEADDEAAFAFLEDTVLLDRLWAVEYRHLTDLMEVG